MKTYFADAFFYVALLDERDQHHQRINQFVEHFRDFIVTTRWVLAEVANGLAASLMRGDVAAFLQRIENDPDVKIVGDSDGLYQRGLALYTNRPDKEWSLTDCISFVVMADEELAEALTRDHHFKQAGFAPIFADAP